MYVPLFVRILALLAVATGAMTGTTPENRKKDTNKKADLSNLVIVGDSLTAGFQNFSLYDSNTAPAPGGQQYGWANQVAKQAGAVVPLRLISYPGIPPALQLTSSGIVRASGVGGPENPSVQAHNIAVPGFDVGDALAHPFPGDPVNNPIDAMSDLIIGTPGTAVPGCGPIPSTSLPFPVNPPSAFAVSEAVCAAALKPTTILVSIGTNDALQSLTFGLPPTDPSVFATQYSQFVGSLAATGASIVLTNIPDVTVIPFLVPVPAFVHQCGAMPVGPPGYTVTDADFVVLNIVDPTISVFNICTAYQLRPAALIAQTRAAITAYNQIIEKDAGQFGAALFDLNKLLAHLQQDGFEVAGRRLTTQFMGGLFSLDGVHPTNVGYALIANGVIRVMNTQLGTDIPPLSIEQVAKDDPLLPPK